MNHSLEQQILEAVRRGYVITFSPHDSKTIVATALRDGRLHNQAYDQETFAERVADGLADFLIKQPPESAGEPPVCRREIRYGDDERVKELTFISAQ